MKLIRLHNCDGAPYYFGPLAVAAIQPSSRPGGGALITMFNNSLMHVKEDVETASRIIDAALGGGRESPAVPAPAST